MTRIFLISVACACLYAAVLTTATAQEATPTSTSTATATPESTSTPASTPTSAPTTAPTSTPEAEPTQTAQPASSPEEVPPENAKPYPSPVETVASPTPEPTPGSLGREVGKDRKGGKGGSSKGERKRGKRRRPSRDGDSCETVRVRKGRLVTDLSSARGGLRESRARRLAGSSEGRDCGLDEVVVLERDERSEPAQAPDGSPTPANPDYALATPGAAPIGVPNFFIDKFRIPPFLLPIYQAAGMEYGVRWEVLAAINEIETDYGRNLNVSTAGALGWMQFMPATWEAYGTDANKDGVKDPYNPVDAIFAAARYLKAAGADTDLYRAIFAYNHADWYVESVLMRARVIGGLPSNFVGSLTGLTQARFPVHARATYAGDLSESDRDGRKVAAGNAAFPVEGDEARRSIEIFARRGAPVIAVNDAKVVAIGQSRRLGRYVQIQDVYGNTFTYGGLASVAKTYPAPREKAGKRVMHELELPRADAAPTSPASATTESRLAQLAARATGDAAAAARAPRERATDLPAAAPTKERLFANPDRPNAREAGGEVQLAEAGYAPDAGAPLQLNRRDYEARPLRKGARLIAGTILGRIGKVDEAKSPHVLFEIRPAGRGAPRIDPKPILDGWKLLESTAIYRAAGKNPFFGPDAEEPSIGQILLMSKELLQRRVLANPRIDIYGCGRADVRIGAIDRRVLATLEFLAASGLRPTVTSLKCGHGFYTASGNVSHHSSGNAVDIAAINGIVITPATQGKGSITDVTIQRLLTLQGTMKPDQIISLMKFEGTDNTFAMGDHDDHIHVGWQPLYGTNSKAAKQVNAVLQPKQWIKLIDRLNEIDNPTVATTPSKYAIKAARRAASHAHRGE